MSTLVLDVDNSRAHTMVSQKDHMRMREMYTGSQTQAEKQFYTVDDSSKERIEKPKFVRSKLSYTPACYKIIDEILVNAADHCTNYPGKVTYIKIIYDVYSGVVQVINNGPGIPIYPVEIKFDRNGEPTDRHLKNLSDLPTSDPNTITKWLPQFLSEQPNTGNNLQSRKVHITGGVNGAGMKLTNYYSEHFTIETVDQTRKRHYKQRMENGARIIHPPAISDISQMSPMPEPFTSITFKPDYVKLDYPNPNYADFVTIEKLIKTRAYQISSYTTVQVYFQNKLIPAKNIADLGEMFAPELKKVNLNPIVEEEKDEETDSESKSSVSKVSQVMPGFTLNLDNINLDKLGSKDKSFITGDGKLNLKRKGEKTLEVVKRTYVYATQLRSPTENDEHGNPLLWNVCVGPSMSEKFEHMSVVNGMYIIDGGSHIDYILDQVINYFASEICKVTELFDATRARIKNNIYVVMIGPINKPSIDSQTKEKISNSKKQYEGYRFTPKQLKEIWNMCEPFIMSDILENGTGKNKKKKPSLDKYRPAKFSKFKGRAAECSLFVPEGDSASNLIDGALTDKSMPNYTYDYYGFYNIQGVPMNARKFSYRHIDKLTGKSTLVYTDAIHDNERLEGLYYILGLDEKRDYRSEEDMKTLKYGSVILATDQDEDGKGNITSLILNYFMVFWPALIERGYVKRLNTPIIRSTYKKTNAVKSFNSISAFQTWQRSLGITQEKFAQDYETHYYKGLARHDEDDIRDIFNHFEKNLHVYCLDEKSQELFEQYFGKSADARKEHLRTPVNLDFAENAHYISVSHHLAIDTKSYKRYKITCMLPHAYDGFLNTRRKIFTTARRVMNKTQTMNVSALAGRVRSDMHHHHGDSAITDSITKMGQEFFPRIIPIFLGNSIAKGFGSRKHGGNNAGQPRYLEIKQNIKVTDLLLPEEDDWLLPYTFEEGERCEPKYYLPIIPMALLETQHHPAHGWDIRTYARDWKSVFRNVKTAIQSFQIIESKSESESKNPYMVGLKVVQAVNPSTRDVLIKSKQSVPDYFPDDGNLYTPLEFMKMDTSNWRGQLKEITIPSNDPTNPPKVKLYSVGSYEYDPKSNLVKITELPHGVSSDNYTYGNRKLIEKRKAEFEKAEEKAKNEAKRQWAAERAAEEQNKDEPEKKTRGRKKKEAEPEIVLPRQFQLSSNALLQLSSVPVSRRPKNSVMNANHGNEITEELLDLMNDDKAVELNLDSDNSKFVWKAWEFLTSALIDKEFVSGVDDRSTDKEIEIFAELSPGSMAEIQELKSEVFDGVIEHFKLRTAIHDSLNFIDGDSEYIREFKNYDEIFRSWFVARKALYEKRFMRTLIAYELMIYKLQLIQKFCDETRRDSLQKIEPKFTLARKSKDEQAKILEQFGYPKIGTEIINNPAYIPVEMIKYEALQNPENLNYKYILSLTQYQTSDDSYAERTEEIARLQNEINKLIKGQRHFPGAVWWLDELNKLETVVQRGLSIEGWGYDQRKKKYT
jgi:DNA gyrase/topoisomerase IV subunit B